MTNQEQYKEQLLSIWYGFGIVELKSRKNYPNETMDYIGYIRNTSYSLLIFPFYVGDLLATGLL